MADLALFAVLLTAAFPAAFLLAVIWHETEPFRASFPGWFFARRYAVSRRFESLLHRIGLDYRSTALAFQALEARTYWAMRAMYHENLATVDKLQSRHLDDQMELVLSALAYEDLQDANRTIEALTAGLDAKGAELERQHAITANQAITVITTGAKLQRLQWETDVTMDRLAEVGRSLHLLKPLVASGTKGDQEAFASFVGALESPRA